MSNDIISKALTTTRSLELEYHKFSLLRESDAEFDPFTAIEKTGKPSLIAELAIFADAIWQ